MSRNDINVEDVAGTSQYDGLQVLKDTHSLPGHYIRTRESLAVVTTYFDSFEIQYNGNLPEIVDYYAGTKAHLTTIAVTGDSFGSLAGNYFIISSGRKEAKYVLFYTVDGYGSAPNIANTIELEVAISENDPASVVAYATQIILQNTKAFEITRTQAVLEIKTKKLGITNSTIDGGTGFTIQNDAGARELVDTVRLTYSLEGFPIWQSQELKDYKYNIYTARFELDESFEVELETTASNFTINEIPAPNSNVAVTVNIPNSTKKFIIQARNASSIVKVVDNITGDEFTLRYGCSLSFDNLNTVNLSFDVKTNKEGNIIELLTWQ